MSMLLTLFCALIVLTSATAPYEFGFKTINPSSYRFTVTLIYDPEIYQCVLTPSISNTLYTCSDATAIQCAPESTAFEEVRYGMDIEKQTDNRDSVQIDYLYIKEISTGVVTEIAMVDPVDPAHVEWVGYHHDSKDRANGGEGYHKLYRFFEPDGSAQTSLGETSTITNVCNTFPPTSPPVECPECPECPITIPCTTESVLDIGILIDESSSIKRDEYDIMIDFIKRLIAYDINDKSYLSLFRYADVIDFEQFVNFNELTDKSVVLNDLDNHIRAYGRTNTGNAIKQTLALFDTSNTNPDLLFVITDGVSNDVVCDIVTATDIGDIEIVLIGVGDDLSLDILKGDGYNCLYDDALNDVYYIPDFTQEAFIDKEDELRVKTCQDSSSGSRGLLLLIETNNALQSQINKLYFMLAFCAVIMMVSINMNFCLHKKKRSLQYEKVNQSKDDDNNDF